MNKPLGVLVGIVVIAGALNTAGAWYTGTKLEGVLQTSIQEANKELASQLQGTPTHGSVELVSLDRHLYSSTAHYRVKVEDDSARPDAEPVELLFVADIEHGPLPWSRLKTFKWMPVMATTTYALEKTPFTEKWFAAAKDQSPLQGQVTLSYNRSVEGRMEFLPLEVALDENSSLSFSGMTMEGTADADGQNLKGKGYMDHFKLHAVSLNKPPLLVELNGLTVASDLDKSEFGFFLGQNFLGLSESRITFGIRQSLLKVNNFEYTGSTSANGKLLSGRLDYKVGDVSLNNNPVGSAQLVLSASSLDIPAMQSMLQIYQTKFQPKADGALPASELTPAEQVQLQTSLDTLLAGKPQMAVEKLAVKTPHGESEFNLAMALAQPAALDQPPVEITKQLLTSLVAKLQLSKPMIADLAGVQAQLEGQTDPQTLAQVGTMTSDMVGNIAVGTGLAKVEGNNIVASLDYAAGQVDFNGQKMSLEDFITQMTQRFNAPIQ